MRPCAVRAGSAPTADRAEALSLSIPRGSQRLAAACALGWRRREGLQRQLDQATPQQTRQLDIERAVRLLGDMPSLLDSAAPAQQRALLRQVMTTIWIEKFAVTAMKPAANFLLLVETITETTGIDGDLGGGRTHNLQLRRLTLYPIELRDRDGDSSIHTTTCQAGWKYEHSIW
jgi:hypothetical protein